MLHKAASEKNRGFTFDSAKKLFNAISVDGLDLCSDLRECFVYSQMTNLKDLEKPKKYSVLVFVEFLDMLARVALSHWSEREEEGQPRDEEGLSLFPETIEEKVEDILKRLWAHKNKNKKKAPAAPTGAAKKPAAAGAASKKKKKAEFPPFEPLDEDSDED